MPSLLLFRLISQRRWKYWSVMGWVLTGAIAVLLLLAPISWATDPSNYDLARQAAFNRSEEYPVKSLPSTSNYRPTGEWVGRLILPSIEEYAKSPGDWVWMEVWYAPVAEPNLVGQKVKLTWTPEPASEAYVRAVSRDVRFTTQAEKAAAQGNVVPIRLNGRKAVGPLQSLTGSRPKDDVTVKLAAAKLAEVGEVPVVQIQQEPIQVTGREYALVKILGTDPEIKKPLPKACPGSSPCSSEYFKVQHYSPATGEFDGDIETVRIPQQPKVQDRFFSTIQDLQKSPAGQAGWYLYGSRDADKVFTVQALKPRALFQLQPDEVILGETSALDYIDHQNWKDTPARKGTLQRVLVSPNAASKEDALDSWKEGDYALVIHLLGGIGGQNQEFSPLGTVTGQFSYGVARVIREPFTRELQFDILYQQAYAHNASGILSGAQDWSAMGDMQKGWLGQRPASDVIVKLDSLIEGFELGETSLSLFQELLKQTQIIAARYRIGDGTGLATVTPALSSVQDSSQALYIAINQIEQQAKADPATASWIKQHPDAPGVKALNQSIQLKETLTKALMPYGAIRADWQNNVPALAGVDGRGSIVHTNGLLSGMANWRSMMPRRAHDDISRIFLLNGAQLWFLRPNQIGGLDPTIEPLAPTLLMGSWPVLGTVMRRMADAVALPSLVAVGVIGGALLLYGAIALPYGFKSKFLHQQVVLGNPVMFALALVQLLFLPALVEEILFRVLLLPHPSEGLPEWQWWLVALLGLGLFVGYHLLSARTYYKQGYPTFFDRRFIALMTWLGIVLTLAYRTTGSLWVVTAVHWVVVAVWLYGLGGNARLASKTPPRLGLFKRPRSV
ncbi:MAG TPA: CPBP family glutamic-type intramembrane protease [Leptolyngbyaceae cyanobacterium]